MARNDVVLLDVLIEKAEKNFGAFASGRDEAFEIFCFEQALKRYDLSFDDLATGWTDGPEDGGVDGFFVFVDDHLVTDDESLHTTRKNPNLVVEVFTVKHAENFKQEPLNSLAASIVELFDLTKVNESLNYPFREDVLRQRACLLHAMRFLADRHPVLTINIYYCCRGDVDGLASNIVARARSIETEVKRLFGNSKVNCCLVGATELLEFYRRERDYSLKLKYTETYFSREGGNYLVLVTLSDYFNFISDETGKLRRYLFESNVRDYLGPVQVNQNISDTLANQATYIDEDFWWLNNGVTILSTGVNVFGKELHIENVQIVNGLQTTETIHTHFTSRTERNDERAVLVKILIAGDAKKQARIIKATNYQNSVDLSSLRGLDKIQRDIEQHLIERDWYYDRRRNLYKNQGKPAHRIVSMAYLASAVRAVALKDPAGSQRSRARSLRDEQVYDQIFAKNRALDVYLMSLEVVKTIEEANFRSRTGGRSVPLALAHYISFVWVAETLKTVNYTEEGLMSLMGRLPSVEDVARIGHEMRALSTTSDSGARRYDGIPLGRDFLAFFLAKQPWIDDLAGYQVVGSDYSLEPVEDVALTEDAIMQALIEVSLGGEPRARIAKAFEVVRAVLEMSSHGRGSFGGGFKRRLDEALVSSGQVDSKKKLRFIFVGIGIARSPDKDCSHSLAVGYVAAVCEIVEAIGALSVEGVNRISGMRATLRAEVEGLRK